MFESPDMAKQQQSYPSYQEMPLPLYSDEQVSQELIKVRSKVAITMQRVNLIDPKTREVVGYSYEPVNTPYKELLTEDLSTAFLAPPDSSVVSALEWSCTEIKAFAENNNIDLSGSYNMIADRHNSIIVASKGTGEGAKIAKSQYIEQKARSWQTIQDEKKQRKLFGLIPI